MTCPVDSNLQARFWDHLRAMGTAFYELSVDPLSISFLDLYAAHSELSSWPETMSRSWSLVCYRRRSGQRDKPRMTRFPDAIAAAAAAAAARGRCR